MNSGSSNRMPSSWGGEESYRPCLFSDLNFESMVLNIFSVFYQVKKKKYFVNGLPRLSRKYWLGYPGFSIVTCNPQSAKPLPPPLSSCFIMAGNSIKLRALTPGTRHPSCWISRRKKRGTEQELQTVSIGWGQIGHQCIILLTSRNWREKNTANLLELL